MTPRNPVPRTERQAPMGSATSTSRRSHHDVAANSARIRIVVADDHALDRAGLVGLLKSRDAFEIVGESSTLEACIARCRVLRPDVLVLALKICSQDQGAAIPAIRAQLPELRILALSERSAERCLVLNPPWRERLAEMPVGTPPAGMDCLQLAAHQGAMATLRRTTEPEDLYLAIRLVARGQASYDATTAVGILQETGGENAGTAPTHAFSERELQVAALIVEAHSNKEIASFLGIREPTVKKHVRHILEKLGLEDRLQAGLHLARNPLLLKP